MAEMHIVIVETDNYPSLRAVMNQIINVPNNGRTFFCNRIHIIIAETDNYPSLRYNHIINTPNNGKIFLYYGWNVHHQRTKQQQNGGYTW